MKRITENLSFVTFLQYPTPHFSHHSSDRYSASCVGMAIRKGFSVIFRMKGGEMGKSALNQQHKEKERFQVSLNNRMEVKE